MDLKTEDIRVFTLTLNETEARKIAGDLFDKKNGYNKFSLSDASQELVHWLSTRNEDVPRGTN